MKKIKYLILPLIAVFAFTSCVDDDNDVLTVDAILGGLLDIDQGAIGYVVGNDGTYKVSGSVYQGRVQTNMVDIYKSFTTEMTTSNETLLASIPITNTTISEKGIFEYSFKYEDLIEGLNIDGTALPPMDSQLIIGDFWTLRFASTTSEGNINFNANITKVSVGNRFAGTYKVIDSDYWRINVQSTGADWIGEERIIESVNASTYRHLGVGPFDPETIVTGFGLPVEESHLYFSITSSDELNYENVGNTTLLEVPYMSCVTNPDLFTNVPCGSTSNYVVRDDVNGRDLIYMTYGYLTPNSGPREFYEVLEKIVE
jgi:hypothetical protein